MRFHRYRDVLVAAAVVSVATALTPAHATADVRAFAADGRELFVGSVVSEGTLTGEECAFADSTVSLLTASGVGTSAVALRVEDDCRLVVTALGAEAPVDAVEPDTNTVTRPKIDETPGLGWDDTTQTGVALHMVSGVAAAGRIGATATGDSPEHAQRLYDGLVACLDDAAGVR